MNEKRFTTSFPHKHKSERINLEEEDEADYEQHGLV
jgi:hypothetical protein